MKNLKTKILLATVCISVSFSAYAQWDFATAASVGMSDAGMERATARLQQHIDDGDISGVVAAVARDGKIVYFESLGLMDIEQAKPMREDALMRVYSMARQVTTVAALVLYELGAFAMDDPIKMYLPEFEDQRVLLDPSSTDITQTRERVGDITVRHLITHTSGLGSRSSRLYRENNVRDKNISLDQMIENAARIPLFEDPGTVFRYGIHATILGKLIEVWANRPFEEFLREGLLYRLDMQSTMFWAGADDRDRLAVVYRPTDGQLQPYQIETIPYTMEPRLIEGGVGLLSTVGDFVNFSQMILDGGMYRGERILQQETVDMIFTNAVPEEAMPIGSNGYWAGSGWTWGGFNLVLDADAYSYPISEGTIWWDGSAGTRFFIDPVQNTVIVIMAQVSPSRGGGFRENFSELIDAAIIDRH
ncbi:MAG: serine hydrolase [Gammaproteobacteria bacterium]|nr:serine hydrolase [Gammaproteobacteria bacterium]MDD9894859.1 serine hydrolase [Gammaproteobacteria bacterium]